MRTQLKKSLLFASILFLVLGSITTVSAIGDVYGVRLLLYDGLTTGANVITNGSVLNLSEGGMTSIWVDMMNYSNGSNCSLYVYNNSVWRYVTSVENHIADNGTHFRLNVTNSSPARFTPDNATARIRVHCCGHCNSTVASVNGSMNITVKLDYNGPTCDLSLSHIKVPYMKTIQAIGSGSSDHLGISDLTYYYTLTKPDGTTTVTSNTTDDVETFKGTDTNKIDPDYKMDLRVFDGQYDADCTQASFAVLSSELPAVVTPGVKAKPTDGISNTAIWIWIAVAIIVVIIVILIMASGKKKR